VASGFEVGCLLVQERQTWGGGWGLGWIAWTSPGQALTDLTLCQHCAAQHKSCAAVFEKSHVTRDIADRLQPDLRKQDLLPVVLPSSPLADETWKLFLQSSDTSKSK